MWPSECKCTMESKGGARKGTPIKLLLWLFVVSFVINMAGAQLPQVQQIQFVPKSYFYQQQTSHLPSDSISEESSIVTSSTLPGDVTRNPRHLAPDRFYVGPATEDDQSATSTTSLRAATLDRAGNPIDFNQDLGQELKLDISSNNANDNTHYETKILSNSQSQPVAPRKPSRGKSRRNKTRPPKNVIIYSLPEQSFYAAGNDESSYSDPDSRESSGLRSDLGEEAQGEQVADSKEFRASQPGNNVVAQKKALLGQCMAQCIDAIL